MAYLIRGDFLPHIQDKQLTQLLTSDDVLGCFIEMAELECRSHLVQKYQIDFELRNVTRWSRDSSYGAGDRVYIDAQTYNAILTYSPGTYIKYDNGVYISVVTTTPGDFNPIQWTFINPVYTFYSAKYPYPLFDLYAQYKIGDMVFYNGHTWKALQNSIVPTADIQYGTYSRIPYPNVYPTAANSTYWQDLGIYVVPVSSVEITNTTYWIIGDTRDVQLRNYMIDIALYHMHQRIAPTNIPLLREMRYIGKETDRSMLGGRLYFPEYSALGWLQGCAEGRITPNLPLIQPKQGNRIRWGGPIKTQNSY